jgi:nucleotidyltransferase substrate binding protein (TIGR01987 family)
MKNEAQIAQFEKTVKNLKEVLEKLKTVGQKDRDYAVFRDSAIQRFEIAFDVCWKTLKERLRQEYGVEANSPKKVFQESFKQGLINNDDIWLKMTDMRNETSHAYNELFAEKVYLELPNILKAFEQSLWKLQK